MAFFGVTIETIRDVRPIPDADRIDLATLQGRDFQFVIAKGAFRPGEQCVYFPVDSLLPAPLSERLGVAGKLAGRDRNRVKTVRLRGQISQGIVASLDLLPPGLRGAGPEALTAHFGVTKFEPPEEIVTGAILRPLPDGTSVYDIEGADRFVEMSDALMDLPVLVTEKVEGSNFSVLVEADGSVHVCQRSAVIVPVEGELHTFHKVAQRARVVDFARSLSAARPGRRIQVLGELLGPKVQGNLYRFADHRVALFDIRDGFDWVGAADFLRLVEEFFGGLAAAAPVLSRGATLRSFLAGRTLKETSDGRSLLAEVPREGIVVRPMEERQMAGFGRLIVKQRSPEYLAKSER